MENFGQWLGLERCPLPLRTTAGSGPSSPLVYNNIIINKYFFSNQINFLFIYYVKDIFEVNDKLNKG